MTDRLEQLLKLREAEPDDPFLTYGIALEHAKQDAFETAIEWLDKTLELDPQYCYAFFQKAKMYCELGEDEQAITVLEEGMKVAKAKGDAHAHDELGELLEAVRAG